MKNCPQCGQARLGEEFKCPKCDVFYSQLDELLFEQQQKDEYYTWKGRAKRIWAANDRKQATKDELAQAWNATPLQTKIVYVTVFAFVFWLVMPF